MAKTNLQSKSAHVTNVVHLPTAAPRKVKQHWNKKTRALCEQLPKVDACHTLLARQPSMREPLRLGRIIHRMEDQGAVALMIATAIFKQLDDSDRLLVQAYCEMAGAMGARRGFEAAAWLDFAVVADTYKRRNIKHVLEMLESGEVD